MVVARGPWIWPVWQLIAISGWCEKWEGGGGDKKRAPSQVSGISGLSPWEGVAGTGCEERASDHPQSNVSLPA